MRNRGNPENVFGIRYRTLRYSTLTLSTSLVGIYLRLYAGRAHKILFHTIITRPFYHGLRLSQLLTEPFSPVNLLHIYCKHCVLAYIKLCSGGNGFLVFCRTAHWLSAWVRGGNIRAILCSSGSTWTEFLAEEDSDHRVLFDFHKRRRRWE